MIGRWNRRRVLTGKRALVTGASGGVGRALAEELAACGVDLVLLARREEPLEETAQKVRQQGVRVVPVVGDVTRKEDRQAALTAAVDKLGGLDLLVNNAGVSAHGRFHEAAPQRLRTIFEVNLFAAAEWIREGVPLLEQSERPMVVNIGSILGFRGVPHNAEYCASKFALRGLGEAMRPELRKLGIDLLHVAPGTIDTEFFDHLVDRQGELPWGRRRGVSPRRVARRTVRAIVWRRREVTVGLGPWLFIRLARFAPRLMDLVFSRYG